MAASASEGSVAISSDAARPRMLCMRNSYCVNLISIEVMAFFWTRRLLLLLLMPQPWRARRAAGWHTHIIGQARDFVCPDSVVPEWVVGKRVLEEVLEEAHVLHGEKGYLVFRLDAANPKISYPQFTRIICRLTSLTWWTICGTTGYSHFNFPFTQWPQAGRVS